MMTMSRLIILKCIIDLQRTGLEHKLVLSYTLGWVPLTSIVGRISLGIKYTAKVFSTEL